MTHNCNPYITDILMFLFSASFRLGGKYFLFITDSYYNDAQTLPTMQLPVIGKNDCNFVTSDS